MVSRESQLEDKIFMFSQELNKCVLCRATLMELLWQRQSETNKIKSNLNYLLNKPMLSSNETQEVETLNTQLEQVVTDYHYLKKKLENDPSVALIRKRNCQLRKLEEELKAIQHLSLTA